MCERVGEGGRYMDVRFYMLMLIEQANAEYLHTFYVSKPASSP